MRKWLVIALLVAVATASAAPATIIRTESASNYYLLVFPFFLQQTPSGLGIGDLKYAGVNISFYSEFGTQVVVDLNHNGRPDPGEPHLMIDGDEQKFRSVFIGYSASGCVRPDIEVSQDIGPLWILVDDPVVATYVWVSNKGGDNLAAYGMPYPGKKLAVPPFPGNVYVTPATTEETTISVNGENITLQPGQYVIIPHDGRGFLEISADNPIVGVLVHLGDGSNDTYMTELYPAPTYAVKGSVGREISPDMLAARFPDGEVIKPEVFKASWTPWWKTLIKVVDSTDASDYSGDYYYIRYRLGDHVASAAFMRTSGAEWVDVFKSPTWGGYTLGTYLRTTVAGPASGAGFRVVAPTKGNGYAYLFYDYGADGTYEAVLSAGRLGAVTPRTASVDGAALISEDGLPTVIEGDDGLNSLMAHPAGYGFSKADTDYVAQHLGIAAKQDYRIVMTFIGGPDPIYRTMWSSCAPGATCPIRADIAGDIDSNYYIIVFNTSMIPLTGVEVTPEDAGKTVTVINLTAPLTGILRIYTVKEAGTQALYSGSITIAFTGTDNEEARQPLNPEEGVPGTQPVTPPQTTQPITPPAGTAEVIGEGYRETYIKPLTLNLSWAAEVVKAFQQTGSYELPQTPAIGKQECPATTTTTATQTQTETTTTTEQYGEETETTTTHYGEETSTTTTQTAGQGTAQTRETTTTTPTPGGINTTTLAIIGIIIVVIVAAAAALRKR